MNDQIQIKRCAIYTRKSTDEHLDLALPQEVQSNLESHVSYLLFP